MPVLMEYEIVIAGMIIGWSLSIPQDIYIPKWEVLSIIENAYSIL